MIMCDLNFCGDWLCDTFLNLKKTLNASLLNTRNSTIEETLRNPIVSNLSDTVGDIKFRDYKSGHKSI